jgi:hypothetical protein
MNMIVVQAINLPVSLIASMDRMEQNSDILHRCIHLLSRHGDWMPVGFPVSFMEDV